MGPSTFYKIVCGRCDEEMSLGSPAKFDKSINSKFNESTPVFTKDGKPSISQNNYLDGRKEKTE
jgi:hypothetical protein